MSAQTEAEKRLDAYWQKHNVASAPAPVARKKAAGISFAALDISPAAEAQAKLFRAEASQPDTSPHMRGRLAKASIKAMGLDNLFAGPPGTN